MALRGLSLESARAVAGRLKSRGICVEQKQDETIDVDIANNGRLDISDCSGCTIRIANLETLLQEGGGGHKCAAVSVTKCTGCSIVLDAVLASLAVTNSAAVTVTVGRCRSVVLDSSTDCRFVTACRPSPADEESTEISERNVMRVFTSGSRGIVVAALGADEYSVSEDMRYDGGDSVRNVTYWEEERMRFVTQRCNNFGTPIGELPLRNGL